MRSFGVAVRLALFLVLFARPEPAAACPCCDPTTKLVPLGWSQDGKTLLLEQTSNVACEPLHQLVEWAVDKPDPEGCYNLLDDPNARVACAAPGDWMPPEMDKKKPKRSKVERTYAKKAVPLTAANLRVKRQRDPAADPDATDPDFLFSVEIKSGKVWRQIWSETAQSYDGLRAVLWPAPKGDRAFLVLTYKESGSGHTNALPFWVSLAAP